LNRFEGPKHVHVPVGAQHRRRWQAQGLVAGKQKRAGASFKMALFEWKNMFFE